MVYCVAACPRKTESTELAADTFYLLSTEMMGIIEQQYYQNPRYRDFDQFFPVLLAEVKKNHPVH